MGRELAGADWSERQKKEIWEAERRKRNCSGEKSLGKNRFIADISECGITSLHFEILSKTYSGG